MTGFVAEPRGNSVFYKTERVSVAFFTAECVGFLIVCAVLLASIHQHNISRPADSQALESTIAKSARPGCVVRILRSQLDEHVLITSDRVKEATNLCTNKTVALTKKSDTLQTEKAIEVQRNVLKHFLKE